MSYKDLLDVVLILRNDVWLQWGWVIAVNIALIGWMIQRHGLYGLGEKVIATIAYTAFLLLIYLGMDDTYKKLDLAANELYRYDRYYQAQKPSGYLPVCGGIIQAYIARSPEYCSQFDKNNEKQCRPYSDNFNLAIAGLVGGWIQNMLLFWYSRIWRISRRLQTNKEKGKSG